MDIKDKKHRMIKFIVCDVIYDEIKSKILKNWDAVNFKRENPIMLT